jgi:hypothetical protein
MVTVARTLLATPGTYAHMELKAEGVVGLEERFSVVTEAGRPVCM